MDEKYYLKIIKLLIDELEEQTFWRNYYQNKDIEREKECKKHTGENI